MFYGRESELEFLNKKYDSGKFEFIPVLGRRRVGKTALLKEFVKEKEGIYYTPKSSYRSSLEYLSKLVYGHVADVSLSEILHDIALRGKDERYILIIDEFTRLTAETKEFSYELQDFIDEIHQESKLFIIVCGSSVNLMKREVLEYRSPLYGRRTGMLKVHPLTPWDSFGLLKGFTVEESLIIWGMVGGIPYYLNKFDGRIPLVQNIAENFLRFSPEFEDEPIMMMAEDYDKPETVQSIISAVSSGCSRISEISKKCHRDSSQISTNIGYLCNAEIITKIRPVDKPDGKTTRYCLSDHFLRFWYRHIESKLDSVNEDNVIELSQQVLSEFNTDMGYIFEEICGMYLKHLHPGSIGKWWGPDKTTRNNEEIDLIVTSDIGGRRVGWFAECKFRNQKPGISDLNKLRYRSGLVNGYDEIHYVMFSKSGFSEELLNENIELYTLEDVFRDMEIGYEYIDY